MRQSPSRMQTAAKTRAVNSFMSVREGRGLFGGGNQEGDPMDYNPLKEALRRNDALINVKGSFYL